MTHHLLDYPTRLRDEGFRVTPQRQLILDAICEAGQHVSIDRIIRTAQARSPRLNRATIYRNLIFLRDRHLVVSTEMGGETFFEIARREPHHHLVCRRCSAEEDLEHELVAPLFETIQRRKGFLAECDHLTLTGICSACQKKNPAERLKQRGK
jgi:Fur family transcriptional regulator, ferric uptake regulator